MRQKIKQKAKLLAAINLAVGAAGMCGAWFLYGNLKMVLKNGDIVCVFGGTCMDMAEEHTDI